MIDYENMSDFEINKMVSITLDHHNGDMSYYERLSYIVVDFCNNPSDMMHLCFEHGISLIHDSDEGRYAVSGYSGIIPVTYDFICCDKNPLRAAAIVYLKMMENEK